MSIPTVEENIARLAELKRKLLEAVDFCTSIEEEQSRRRNATQTPIQGKEEESDAEYDPEDASKDNYPMHEGRE